jgi:hypothetical protein
MGSVETYDRGRRRGGTYITEGRSAWADWKKERGQDMQEGRVEVKCDFCDVRMPAIAQESGFPKACVLCGIGEVYPVRSHGEAM